MARRPSATPSVSTAPSPRRTSGSARPAPAPKGSRPPRRRAPERRRRFTFWQYFFLAAVGFTTIMAAICVGVFVSFVSSLPPIEKLEQYDPPEITRVVDRTGAQSVGDFKTENRQVVSIKDIPDRLRNAFIAIEDERFYDHFGIDIFGVIRAMMINFKAGSMRQGASTITQQMARNVLGSQVGHDKSMERKIREAIASIQIEHRYSKDQILEFYLNHIEFNNNAFGIQAAATTNFSKNLNDLTVAECALLAALPKSPTIYSPFRHPDRAIQRRNLVLENMLRLDMIDKKAYEAALKEPLRLNRSSKKAWKYPFFVDGLLRDMHGYYGLADKQINEAGLRITSTIDPPIQEACERALREGLVAVERKWQGAKEARLAREYKNMGAMKAGQTRLMRITKVNADNLKVELDGYRATVKLPDYIPYYDPERILKADQLIDIKINKLSGSSGTIEAELGDTRPVQGSLVVLDAQTGEVLALVGGTNYYDKTIGWFNRAVQGGRQPGSCFKPFVYACAEEKGWGPNSIIIDEPIQYALPNRAPYRPKNYTGEGFAGPMTLLQALQESRNIVTLRLFEALRVKSAVEQIKQFDFSQNGERWNIPPQIAVSLGTIDVSPLQLASAYQVFANLGTGSRPQFFRSVVDRDGRVRVPRKDREFTLMTPVAAAQMQYMLRQVVIQRTGTGFSEIGSKFPTPTYPVICGKTGTTQDNIDAWFVGFTPDLVIACDVGFDDRKSMGPRLTGGKVAGPIWADAFRQIMKIPGRTWRKTFDAPGTDVEYANICGKTGKRAGPACSESDHFVYPLVPFKRGQAPAQVCDGTAGSVAPLIAPVGAEYAWEASVALTHGFAQPSYAGTGEPGDDTEGGDSDLQ
jgi:penicillin-binding protein 1A